MTAARRADHDHCVGVRQPLLAADLGSLTDRHFDFGGVGSSIATVAAIFRASSRVLSPLCPPINPSRP
jgi:hypothetical protein